MWAQKLPSQMLIIAHFTLYIDLGGFEVIDEYNFGRIIYAWNPLIFLINGTE